VNDVRVPTGLFGPFAITDLDAHGACFGTLEQYYGERLKAPATLNDLVDAGRFGVKQGGGFVTEAGDQTALIAHRNMAHARLGQLLRELGRACATPAAAPVQGNRS